MPKRAAVGIELLADPTRRRILALVASRVRQPADIATAIGLSRPAVSRQLRLLVDAGILRYRWSAIDRRSRMYLLEPAMQESVIAWLAGVDVRRNASPTVLAWSPRPRVRRLHRMSRELTVDRDDFPSSKLW